MVPFIAYICLYKTVRPYTSFIIGFYHSNQKNILSSLLKFAGYIHNHTILPGNIFGRILEKTRWPPETFI